MAITSGPEPDGISRVLVIVAHPDDVDFGTAGTVALWTDAGIEVSYCLVTSGEAGGSDPSVSRPDMARLRQAEQTAAAKQVGVSDLHFLGYPDGRVEATLELRRDLAKMIRIIRPDRVVCPSPDRFYARIGASHPDHRAVGAAALDAVYPDSRNPFAFPELLSEDQLEPWTVPQVWVSGSPQAGHYVDITAVFGRKMAALGCHASQIADAAQLAERLRGMSAGIAEQAGMSAGTLAEGFQVLQTG